MSERVGEQVRATGFVDLSRLTDFQWDVVHIFSPYTPQDQVCRELPMWEVCQATLPNHIAEGEFLVVFTRGRVVVNYELHPRRNGDYCDSSCVLKLTATNARFRAVPVGTLANGGVHHVLYPAAP